MVFVFDAPPLMGGAVRVGVDLRGRFFTEVLFCSDSSSLLLLVDDVRLLDGGVRYGEGAIFENQKEAPPVIYTLYFFFSNH